MGNWIWRHGPSLLVSAFIGALIMNLVTSASADQVPLNGQTIKQDTERLEVERALQDLGVDLASFPHFNQDEMQSPGPGYDRVCATLKHIFPSTAGSPLATSVIDKSDEEAYDAFTSSYWSQQQAELKPACIFIPASPRALSVQILLSRRHGTPFAVKAGGHASFAGASSAQSGITVSLQYLNEISVSDDRRTVVVGAGSRWRDVYAALETHGLTVVGGRDADVGVGGLVLGGGMSFFSNLHGWACDNIAAYEVVLASGKVVIADSEGEHEGLYWALRGGGGNFGVVTRFWMDTYELEGGSMWGGSQSILAADRFRTLLDPFYAMGTEGAQTDGRANQILAFGVVPGVFGGWMDALNPPKKQGDARRETGQNPAPYNFYNRTLSNLTALLSTGQPAGKRNTYWTATFKMNRDAAGTALDVFRDELEKGALDGAKGLFPALMLQVITAPALLHMRKRGGNPLGLDGDEPRLQVTTVTSWDEAADDQEVMGMNRRMMLQMADQARDGGWEDRYVYMNYASKEQGVFAGYGEENRKRLVDVSRRYDPERVWQRLVNGGHVLWDDER
ncbi:hypothetical protein BJ170DRAFT_715547 [Xylariales sp. AK1849]|nr:hypothetical protein BJ170DRAFT_715547 [Xylariales sp. AK1849]